MTYETKKTARPPQPEAGRRTRALLLLAVLSLVSACSSGKQLGRREQGVYHPEASVFFEDPDPFEGTQIYLDSLRVVEVGEGRPLVLKDAGIEKLLYVNDTRGLARDLRLSVGDGVAVVFYCGEGSLAAGNILRSIRRVR